MKIEQFHIPTNLPPGPINVHLIREDPLTLVDTGPKIPAALDSLADRLHGVGCRIEDIERIVLTHVHEDHFGLARVLQERSGATIFAHPWEAHRLRGWDEYHLYLPIFDRAGVPLRVIEAFKDGYRRIRELADDLEEVEGIEDGDTFEFDKGSFEVLHTPGHTPGSISLYRAADRSLIAGDTVLSRITPNPILSPDPVDPTRRFQSLGEYLVSLSRLRALSPTIVRGGHGPDVTDFEEYFSRIVRKTDERQRTLASLLPDDGVTAWEATRLLFPNIQENQSFLALSETLAHLDFGVSEARFAVAVDEEVDLFRALRGDSDVAISEEL